VQIIRKNFGLKVLSLALAIVGWAYFRFASNPVIAARFDQQISVPIVTTNLPVGYVAHFTDKEAVVTIASRRGEQPIKPDQIKAVIDLGFKPPGVYNLPVELVSPNVVVQSLTPASVSLTIERIEQRSYPLAIHYVGQTQNQIVVSSEQTTPANVVVHGPSGVLSQVTAVRIDIPFATSAEAFDSMVRAVPVDSLGQEVSGLTVAPDLVRVQAQFVKGTGASAKP
jgi:hypothetical protein